MKNFAAQIMSIIGVAVAIVCMGAGVTALVSCTTDASSPLQSEGNAAVDYILQQGASGLLCGQIDCNDSKCSQLYPVTNPEPTSGAKVQICGEWPCTTAGNALNEILAQCVVTYPDNTARSAGYTNADNLSIALDSLP